MNTIKSKQRVADQGEVFTSPWLVEAVQMNQAVFALRRYEDASLRYTGIGSHPGLTQLRVARHGGGAGVTRGHANPIGVQHIFDRYKPMDYIITYDDYCRTP